MKKKNLIIALIALLLLGGGATALVLGKKNKGSQTEGPTPTPEKKKRITEPVNQIPVQERPYLQVQPLADGHNIKIVVNKLKKPATNMEYELEYQAGSLLQGAFGQMEITEPPAENKILLGSCSAGGACTYHKDVKGGTLLTRFTGAEEKYVLKSDWKYIDNAAANTEFSSRDAKFQLESEDLAAHRFLIIFNSPGYPAGLETEPISEIYNLNSSRAWPQQSTAQLTIRANEADEQAQIMGFDGQEWIEFESQVEGKQVQAEVELLPIYCVAVTNS
jgi:hypothetical protein